MNWSVYICSSQLTEEQKEKVMKFLFREKITHTVLLEEGKDLRSYLEGGSDKKSKPEWRDPK